jgi:hypothetical protein
MRPRCLSELTLDRGEKRAVISSHAMNLDLLLKTVPMILALVDAVRAVLGNGGALADELHAAIEASAVKHLSADAADELRAELWALRGGKGP